MADAALQAGVIRDLGAGRQLEEDWPCADPILKPNAGRNPGTGPMVSMAKMPRHALHLTSVNAVCHARDLSGAAEDFCMYLITPIPPRSLVGPAGRRSSGRRLIRAEAGLTEFQRSSLISAKQSAATSKEIRCRHHLLLVVAILSIDKFQLLCAPRS